MAMATETATWEALMATVTETTTSEALTAMAMATSTPDLETVGISCMQVVDLGVCDVCVIALEQRDCLVPYRGCHLQATTTETTTSGLATEMATATVGHSDTSPCMPPLLQPCVCEAVNCPRFHRRNCFKRFLKTGMQCVPWPSAAEKACTVC